MGTRLFRLTWGVIAFLGIGLGHSVRAEDQSISQAKQQLQRQIDLLDSIRPFVERQDLGRFVLLRGASQAVIDAITNKGLMSLVTIHSYEELIMKYRYSVVYFSEISTASTEPAIKEAREIAEQIAKQLNYDDSVFTQVTFNTYDQMHKLVVELLGMTISKELRDELDGLIAPLGDLTSKAKSGDSYEIYQAAIPCASSIQKMYRLFYQVPSSDSAFELVLEIQGLNEWFIEKSRIPVNRSEP